MIKAKLNLDMKIIKNAISNYTRPENTFYIASYDMIKNRPIWKEFNDNWTEKICLVYSWMPRIAGKDFKLVIEKGESFETFIKKSCSEEVLNLGFNLTQDIRLVDFVDDNNWKSLKLAYNFVLKIGGQVAASKIMHFNFPSLCLIWDNDQIMWLYNRSSRKIVNGEDYIAYHKWAQRILNDSTDYDKITQKYGDEYPRILDQCIWSLAKK